MPRIELTSLDASRCHSSGRKKKKTYADSITHKDSGCMYFVDVKSEASEGTEDVKSMCAAVCLACFLHGGEWESLKKQ